MDDAAKSHTVMVRNSVTVRISFSVIERLRRYLIKKYGGHIYGRVNEAMDIAVSEYLDRVEKKGEKIAPKKALATPEGR